MQKIEIELTPEQLRQIEPLEKMCADALTTNETGMMLGQCRGSKITLAFVPQAQALQLQAVGVDEDVSVGDWRNYWPN